MKLRGAFEALGLAALATLASLIAIGIAFAVTIGAAWWQQGWPT